MSIRVALQHKTRYRFDRSVSVSPHVIRLRPAPHSRTPVLAYSLNIKPETHFINWQQDPFGNYLARLVFPEKTRELTVDVELIAEMTAINPFDFFVEEYAEHCPFDYDERLITELAPYLEIKEDGPLLKKWLAGVDRKKKKTNDFLVELNQKLQQDIDYSVRMEPGIQSCEKTLSSAIGSCRDTGWLLVQILRHLGFAARFVSGYLVQLKSDVESLDGPSGPQQDFTDLHAWCEVYLPGAGWVGLDPTSGLFASEGHIPLACTPNPVSAAPITGATGKCEVEFEHSNEVFRIHEDPRVTLPYTETQWESVVNLAEKVDQSLQENDVRLTMGGEPTFVSIDDMESAQWNTAALGADKRRLAGDLLLRLRERFSKDGLLHFGQGKWYPGEEVPRWALSSYWRRDGKPIWKNTNLIATDQPKNRADKHTARKFATSLADHLGLAHKYIETAYEDDLYYLWKEGSLSSNLESQKADLKDSLERKNLAKVLSQGLDEPVGFALPLKWDYTHSNWASGPWVFRRERLYLIPGDSPMGLRLPLDSLPWIAPDKRDPMEERSQFEQLPELGDYHGEVAQRYSYFQNNLNLHPERVDQDSADSRPQVQPKRQVPEQSQTANKSPLENDALREVPHTALCVEERGGIVYVFMPPCTYLEHYLDIVAAVESTAELLELPVRLEGYTPPSDARINKFQITPDPGVIEVNVHPASNWQELESITETLYEEARLCRLGTEKFMLDGRHSGTGGGNHVTLGGPTPVDSPLLRRPDLLRSLISYWQNHPGLSYLFSGLFIGPTSQAPRVDEGREDRLYELEIAFSQMPDGEVTQPWLVDRLLRHLLTDITGNTHRSEFCIDKLYSPDSSSGRQGLLEFRGFEMPPHPRMSLVQTLLLRTLVARFWKKPYKRPLIRWGTELHDKFMLPHYVQRDVADVVQDLNVAGFDFRLDWLDPFLEFRFPHYGTLNIGDVQIDLHWAIEPWHVLGEEMSNLGTARFVDSSVERLQIRVRGLSETRYALTCNGYLLPLHNTGTKGEYVAGVRYRAWSPPSALHPTIGIHAPLVFDLVDTWNGKSIGGCTYHVTHPGGRSYDVFPVNALEAESRRVNRFWEFGHSQDVINLPPITGQSITRSLEPIGSPAGSRFSLENQVSSEFPRTLDLRNVK